jgi:UDP-glucose 4-epimerase
LCHVSDIVNALVLIGAEAWRKTTFNLGTGKNYSVNEVAAMFGSKVTYVPARPGEDRETKADNKFAKKMLGWKPQVSLKDYIAKIVGKKRYVK